MVHSGYEASAVPATFNSLSGFLATVRGTLFTKYPGAAAREALKEPVKAASEAAEEIEA
jgi:hypothetical protein